MYFVSLCFPEDVLLKFSSLSVRVVSVLLLSWNMLSPVSTLWLIVVRNVTAVKLNSFGGGGWSPGCELARQGLYHVSPASSPFCSVILEIGSRF
jgi:hypothetical protein